MGHVVGIDAFPIVAQVSDHLLVAQWQFVQHTVDEPIRRELRSIEPRLTDRLCWCRDAAIRLPLPRRNK